VEVEFGLGQKSKKTTGRPIEYGRQDLPIVDSSSLFCTARRVPVAR
jgi:hypothetical protein